MCPRQRTIPSPSSHTVSPTRTSILSSSRCARSRCWLPRRERQRHNSPPRDRIQRSDPCSWLNGSSRTGRDDFERPRHSRAPTPAALGRDANYPRTLWRPKARLKQSPLTRQRLGGRTFLTSEQKPGARQLVRGRNSGPIGEGGRASGPFAHDPGREAHPLPTRLSGNGHRRRHIHSASTARTQLSWKEHRLRVLRDHPAQRAPVRHVAAHRMTAKGEPLIRPRFAIAAHNPHR
jgi:hypothetical protein